jgi:hypothetical protein
MLKNLLSAGFVFATTFGALSCTNQSSNREGSLESVALSALLQKASVELTDIICLSTVRAGSGSFDPLPETMAALDSPARLVPFSSCEFRESSGLRLKSSGDAAMLVSVDSVMVGSDNSVTFWGQWYRGPVNAEEYRCEVRRGEAWPEPDCRTVGIS